MQNKIVIHKSSVGVIIIALAGVGVAALLGVGVILAYQQFNIALAELLTVAAFVVLLVTLLQAYVYGLSTLTLTPDDLIVTTYRSFLRPNEANTEWRNVQDVDVQEPGILAQMFDVGSILIQTAGTERNLRIDMIPRPQYWRDYIAKMASDAATPVRVQKT